MPSAIEPVEILLDKKRMLRLDWAGLLAAERMINRARPEEKRVSFLNGAYDLTKFSLEDLHFLFWAALLHGDPDLTPDGAKAICAGVPPARILKKTVEALGRAFAITDDDEEAGQEKKASLSNGSASGASPASGST